MDWRTYRNGVSLILGRRTTIEPRTLIAYALIIIMLGIAIYLIVRFRRERTRRNIMRGKYRDPS